MKKIIIIASAVLMLASCAGTQKKAENKYPQYATVEIGTEATKYIGAISENGNEVLNLYRFAAKEADNIYWQQSFGGKEIFANLQDEAAKNYVEINYGPWDRLTGKAFIEGFNDLPLGLKFYPQDMTEEEWAAFADTTKNSPYTLVQRDENGALKTVWYHDAYADNIDKICAYLTSAADLTIVPSVREYLLSKIEALKTDSYKESTIKWFETGDSKMDLIIGPNENSDDNLYGIKRSYSAYVLLKNMESKELFDNIAANLPEVQKQLPIAEEYKASYTPGTMSNIYVGDLLYCAGEANCGIKDVAINLPFDEDLQAELGTRSVIMQNVIKAKFNTIINPLAEEMFSDKDCENVVSDSYFWNTALREVAHGLGVKTTTDGRPVSEALGNAASSIEDAKALALGAWLAGKGVAAHQVKDIVTEDSQYATFLASLLKSSRFGKEEAVGRANLICYTFLKEQGAYARHNDGCYYIDYAAFKTGLEKLINTLIDLQAKGDYAAASAFVEKYAVVDKDLDSDIFNMGLENIPVDVKFNFTW